MYGVDVERLAETGCGVLMTSISSLAPKGSRCEMMSCWFGGGPVGGRNCENCLRPKAVRTEAMFVSCEKSK